LKLYQNVKFGMYIYQLATLIPSSNLIWILWMYWKQKRIFIFGALGYFWLRIPLERFRWLMSYTLALHVLALFTEQVVSNYNHIPLFWIPSMPETKTVIMN